VQFADLVFDPGRRRLERSGREIRLSKLSFRCLNLLVDAAPNLVTHEEFANSAWGPNRIVTPENLAKRLFLLRRTLGDDPGDPKYIEGIRGQGYRLIPSVEPADDGATGAAERTLRRNPPVLRYGITAILAASVAASAFWLSDSDRDATWLANEALPRIDEALNLTDWESAFALVTEVEQRFPEYRELEWLWARVSWETSIPSEPPGARVFLRAYGREGGWKDLGTTPLQNIRIPFGLSEIRIELDGYHTLHRTLGGDHFNGSTLAGGAIFSDGLLVGPETYVLDPVDAIPADKVRVSGWTFATSDGGLPLDSFLLGRHEVTNREFKAFIDANGYQRPEFWDPIVIDDRLVPWAEAMTEFLDLTGRPGPGTWLAGDYPDGEGDMPVSGVSWYEARAYARFVGDELPTAHHWQQALATSTFPWLLSLSNFSRNGPRPVTESRALSYSGAFDMAGNVREWTENAIGDERIILGGNWNDPYYIAGEVDTSAPPWDRSPGNGFRLARTWDPPEVHEIVAAPFVTRSTAASTKAIEPVDDEIYAAYSRVFDYDRTPLNALVESTDQTRVWTRERITFDSAYNEDRVIVHLYLPTSGSAPFQTVVYWSGWDTFRMDDVDFYFTRQIDFLVRNGRAVAFPVLPGTFERRVGDIRVRPDFGTAAWRDNTIDSVRDIRRTIDYLETRDDIDDSSLAYFGYSWGGVNAPVMLAQEDRFRTAIIDIGLMPAMPATPEVDPAHSLPRIRVPTLLLSGEFDAMVQRADAERFFDLIGVAPDLKKHVIALGGHYIPRDVLMRESLDWLDAYLGPPAAD